MNDAICSAKGCLSPAVWAVRWNNPKIHTPDRRKIWLACDEHRESLSHFLESRGFLRSVDAFTGTEVDPGPEASTDR